MMNHWNLKYTAMSATLTAAMLLSACGAQSTASVSAEESIMPADTPATTVALAASTSEAESVNSDVFSKRDLSEEYDAAEAVTVILDGNAIRTSSDTVQIAGSTATITAAGTYIISGSLEDGSIIVDAGEEDKVQLVLDGASITSDTFAAIYVKQADKVFISLADGTVSTLENGGTFVQTDDNNVDGVIFSKEDLTINGTGTLIIRSSDGNGIVCKDDLVITGGVYEITAAGHALETKDSISIADGAFSLTSGKDGIHAENGDDDTKGGIYISGGDYTITSDGDGIDASGTLTVEGGSFSITAGSGAASAPAKANAFGRWNTTTASSSDTVSAKGIKANGDLALKGGEYTIDAADDGIHTNANLTISAGQYTIVSGDDGIHADSLVQIDGSSITVTAYEGIEGNVIRINDGEIAISASDDGINAAKKSGTTPAIEINGGSVTVAVGAGDTDCIDSNGNLTITGGTINVTGNSTFDIDGSITFTGGTVIVNGQQVNSIPSQMMGGRGGGRGNAGGMGGRGGGKGSWSM